jgi:hypothetical protein
MDQNAAYDPNLSSWNASTDNQGQRQALENNDSQISQFDSADFPGDFVDQEIELSTSLYIEARGVYNTNTFARQASVNGVPFGAQTPNLGGTLGHTSQATVANINNNSYPTARVLFNLFNPTTVKASTGGFLNWICDGNANFVKAQDTNTGAASFDSEINNLITTTFGFPRLTDLSPPVATTTPVDGQAAPNDTCQAAFTGVNVTNSTNTVTLASGNWPTDILSQGLLSVGNPSTGNAKDVGVTGTGFAAGTFVVSGGGTPTLTLSNNFTGTTGTETLEFSGVPAVQSVADSQH